MVHPPQCLVAGYESDSRGEMQPAKLCWTEKLPWSASYAKNVGNANANGDLVSSLRKGPQICGSSSISQRQQPSSRRMYESAIHSKCVPKPIPRQPNKTFTT